MPALKALKLKFALLNRLKIKIHDLSGRDRDRKRPRDRDGTPYIMAKAQKRRIFSFSRQLRVAALGAIKRKLLALAVIACRFFRTRS